MIPRTIHYCWFGDKEKPAEVLRMIANWQKHCPGYEIKEWNENNFDIRLNRYCEEAYATKKWAFVSDVARLWALVHEGGVYMDTDVELVRPLDRLLTNKAFLGFEGTQWVGTNLIGAEPSHSFFIELLKSYDHRCFITPDGKPDQTTNVEELTRKLEKVYGFRKDGSFQQLGDITLYPTDYFCPYDYIDGQLHQERKKIPRVSGFEDVKVTELSHEALKSYLKERGIDPAIAGRFCKEVAYGIRGKRYFAIGFMNRSGGYELRNPMFKGCISPKDISCVSLSGKKQDTCCVFEGFVDFLSALVLRTVADEDCLVLNSVSNLERSYAVLEGYGKIRCFLDRDRAGITALETLNIHFGNKVMDCSGLYDGFKDLNEYLTKTKENK